MNYTMTERQAYDYEFEGNTKARQSSQGKAEQPCVQEGNPQSARTALADFSG
jgi:hypothetical protein